MLPTQKPIMLTTIIVAVVAVTATFVFQREECDQLRQLNTPGGVVPAPESVQEPTGPATDPALAILDSLPVHPQATWDETARVDGEGWVLFFYFVRDEPEEVLAFYATEFASHGWMIEQPPTPRTRVLPPPEGRGREEFSVIASFIKDNVRVQMTAFWNGTGSARLGSTYLHVMIETPSR